jgi:hypothetical protein
MEEGEFEEFLFCITVVEFQGGMISRNFSIDPLTGTAKNITDYVFYNQTITFNGSYSAGDSECVSATAYAPDDYEVEGTESFNVRVDLSCGNSSIVCIFIVDDDYLKVAFSQKSYYVTESAGMLAIKVEVLANEYGIIPEFGLPLGVRVTSRDGSAVAGEDFEYVLTTVYFRPLHYHVMRIYISILNDSVQEGKEQFTVELSAFDLSIILVNSVAEVVIEDDDVSMCPELQPPADGSVEYSSTVVGSVAEYSCNEGFVLDGLTTRVCQIDGVWSHEEPSCLIDDGICTVELIYPIEVEGTSAAYAFRGVGADITSFRCKLDGVDLLNCESPLTDLAPGLHRLRVVPIGCDENQGSTFRFTV